MLNYIWGGLIGFSLVFALTADILDFQRDTYRNGTPVAVTVTMPDGYAPDARRMPVQVALPNATVRDVYGVEANLPTSFDGILVQTADGRQLRFAEDASLPEPLNTIREVTSARDNDLRGTVTFTAAAGDSVLTAALTFAPVRFVKLNAITQASLDFADTAVTLSLGLIGVLALWLGLLKIAEAAGLIHALVRVTQPLLRPLFPDIPKDHPAMGMIVLNLSANMLGLGNAATPLGIKAMEELQTINPDKETASDSMVMLLAMNTASVQIVPPSLLIAIMGLQVNQLFFSILIVTACSLVVAVITARILSKLPRYRLKTPPPASPDDASASDA
ncbi:MAG: nucleoside recognition domain-containing protein [Rhodothermales bacterium]